jgi:hypothetical protein
MAMQVTTGRTRNFSKRINVGSRVHGREHDVDGDAYSASDIDRGGMATLAAGVHGLSVPSAPTADTAGGGS